jgi:PAS domain S-box-containing protein
MSLEKNHQFDLFSFFEMTPDLVCIAGKDGFFKKVNKAVLEKLEYTEEEIYAQPIVSFQHNEDREITARTRAELLAGNALVNFENRYISKTGKILWFHWTSIFIPDKEVVFAIAKDVTAKKVIEFETVENFKKFKGLATHFKTHIEKERKSFAFELHEDLAQLASVIKMDVAAIKNNAPDLNDFLKARLENAAAVSQLLMEKIRKLSFSISPNILEQLGLNETLEWLSKEFTSINNIPCIFTSNYNEEGLSTEIKIDLFRICQESLNNVMNHAQAKSVYIILEDLGNEICLSIIDNGQGFDIARQKMKSGFKNMNELATILNGNLQIESEQGNGTKICFKIEKIKSLNEQR